jgi:hypothetical protein
MENTTLRKRNFTPKRIAGDYWIMIHSFKILGVFMPAFITFYKL